MKYIIIRHDILNIPILFPDYFDHSDIAPKFGKVIAAGDVSIYPMIFGSGEGTVSEIGITCSGKSSSLNISSRGFEDEQLIKISIDKY